MVRGVNDKTAKFAWSLVEMECGAGDQLSPPEAAGHTMKAIVYQRYGSPNVVQLKDGEDPRIEDNEELVEVHASSVIHGTGISCEVHRS